MDLTQPIYITTPLYYVNDELHLGHSTTTIYADTLARFWRALGRPVLFLTGSDEHGQKIFDTAKAAGTDPKTFADRIVVKFFELWEALDISYDVFIRTTDKFHEDAVQVFFKRLKDKGLVFKDMYRALYCVGCETNYTAKDLVDGKCPVHKTVPQKIEEENYFFKLSAFAQPLLDHIAAHPDCIVPEGRRNEIVGKLKEGLIDASVSRTKFDWGVRMPGDEAHVLWVWFDALLNYVTALGWPDSGNLPTGAIAGRARHAAPAAKGKPFVYWWPQAVHLVGKDILWHHSVVWWSMLMGADIAPPRQVLAHGWWQVEGDKMGKSLGNVIKPLEVANKYSRDALRYFILREGPLRGDADWRQLNFVNRYNADLANGLGNLVNRSLNMLLKYFGGAAPAEMPFADGKLETARGELKSLVAGLREELIARMNAFEMDNALEAIWKLVRRANLFVDETKPFSLAKDPARKQDLAAAMHALTEVSRVLGAAVTPFLPDTAVKIAEQLACKPGSLADELAWGKLPAGHKIGTPAALFARIETT
ncbi:MAG: methionine--tRNA ligase [Planctomycetes bacterium]|nr:methionine--tRNA ligase [Planctomycetota bacterium]